MYILDIVVSLLSYTTQCHQSKNVLEKNSPLLDLLFPSCLKSVEPGYCPLPLVVNLGYPYYWVQLVLLLLVQWPICRARAPAFGQNNVDKTLVVRR